MFRGPDSFSGGSNKYILNRESFNPREEDHNEFIVDNWKPVGLIVSMYGFPLTPQEAEIIGSKKVVRYAEVALEIGLPVYDRKMKAISKERIEAALNGKEEKDYGGF
jgi:hypothetical protein